MTVLPEVVQLYPEAATLEINTDWHTGTVVNEY